MEEWVLEVENFMYSPTLSFKKFYECVCVYLSLKFHKKHNPHERMVRKSM